MITKVNHRSWLLVGSLFAISSVISVREYVPPPQVPEVLRVPDGQTVLLKALGKGVQIYDCMATAADPGKFDWSFKAPEADLTTKDGKKIAKHYAGPTWEANDGSKVVGEVQKKADAPRPGAVPWLLLSENERRNWHVCEGDVHPTCRYGGRRGSSCGLRSGPRQH